MGVISILLGIITFIGMTGGGAVLGNMVGNWQNNAGEHLLFLNNFSNNNIMIGFIAVFGVIGLLIMVSLVMQGITYNKVVKIQKRVRRL